MIVYFAFSCAEYSFEVFHVKNCPMSKESWETASTRLKCNSTHGYHCVPNKQFTSLIEFCYPKGPRFPFEAGNCLELADVGILNQVYCNKTFSSGCPETYYFSNDLYKYPKCLQINTKLNCFDADIECIISRSTEHDTSTKKPVDITTIKNIDENHPDGKTEGMSPTTIALLIVVILCVIIITVAIVVICLRLRQKGPVFGKTHDYRMVSHEPTPTGFEASPMEQRKSTRVVRPMKNENNEDNLDGKSEDSMRVEIKSAENIKPYNAIEKLQLMFLQGKQQQFEDFIDKNEDEILKQKNSLGFNCLHFSAKLDNDKIFNKLLDKGFSIDETVNDGRTVLHIAAHQGCHSICDFILKLNKLKDLFCVKDKYMMNPAHWAALSGKVNILEFMLRNECNLGEKTGKYEENIVLFACIGKNEGVCRFVKSNESISSLLHEKNKEGWNSIQYAAKSGDIGVFTFLVEAGVDILNKSRNTGKNCLHTACEKGHVAICKYILDNMPELVNDRDKNGQHAGHFAAKSGKTEIFQLLLDQSNTQRSLLAEASSDDINILHVACKHAKFDMCVQIAKTFPSLINQITERGWNAALFVAEKSGAEKERIKILKHLVRYKLDVYHVSRSGKTILFNACANQSIEMVKYLLDTYPDLLNIEKAMNPKETVDSREIHNIFSDHYEKLMNI